MSESPESPSGDSPPEGEEMPRSRHAKCQCGAWCTRSKKGHYKHACSKHNRYDEPTANNAARKEMKFRMGDVVYKAKGIFGPWDHGGR